MKKILVVLLVLLLAGGLFAQDGEKSEDKLAFKYGGMMYIYNTRQRTTDGGDPLAYWNTRFRQYFSVGNKNIEAMVKLEMDPVWGAGEGTGNVNLEADMKGELQIKNAYLKFTMPCMPLTVKAGIQYIATPGRFMFANDVGGITLTYKTSGICINGIYGKLGEFGSSDARDDAAIYGLSAGLGDKSMKITPGVYYLYKGSGVDTGDIAEVGLSGDSNFHGVLVRNAIIPQVNFSMKSDSLSLCATAAYGFGKIKDAATLDAKGLGIDVKLSYTINKSMKIGFVGNYLSGDDSGSTDSFDSFAQFMPGYIAADTAAGGWVERGVRLTGASLFLQGGLTATPAENIGKYSVWSYGLMMAGINFTFETGKLKVKACGVWLNAAEDYSAGNKSYGVEADFFVEYEVFKNLKLQAEANYFIPSSDYQGSLPDVCTFYAVGTTFKW